MDFYASSVIFIFGSFVLRRVCVYAYEKCKYKIYLFIFMAIFVYFIRQKRGLA